MALVSSMFHHTCLCCSNAKQPLTAVVADASQFYEEVEPLSAVAALGEILARAASKGWTGVFVGRAKKRQAFLSTGRTPSFVSSISRLSCPVSMLPWQSLLCLLVRLSVR